MAVDDHGTEALKKSHEEVKKGDKSNYYQKVGLTDSQSNAPVLILPSGTLNTAEIIRLVGGNFASSGTLLAHDWTETFVGSGSTTITDGELNLNTGTTANSSASVRSFRRAPFSAATFNLTHLAFSLPVPFSADVTCRFGAYNPDAASVNGMYFEMTNGNGVDDYDIKLIRIKNNVIEETILEADFTGGNTFVKDANIHVYEHQYNAGTIYWYQDRKLIHQSGSPTSAAFGTPDLQVGMEIININGNTTDNKLVTRAAAISRIGANNAIPRFFHIDAAGTFTIKNTSGELIGVNINDKGAGSATLTIYNNTTAAGTDIIAVIDTADVQGTLTFDNSNFDIGLTVVVAGINTDITVIYD